MSKLKRRLLLGSIFIIVFLFVGYRYALTIGSRDIAHEESAYEVRAKEWSGEFGQNIEAATQKYLNKTVAVSGVVASIEGNVLTLRDGVSCQLSTSAALDDGELITIKGRVTGYDDLLEEIKLDQCTVLTK